MKVDAYWRRQAESITNELDVTKTEDVTENPIREPILVEVFDNVTRVVLSNAVTGRSYELKITDNTINIENIDKGIYVAEISTQTDGKYLTKLLLLNTSVKLIFQRKNISIQIIRTDIEGASFISTDRIGFRTEVIGDVSNEILKEISWSVRGINANDGNGSLMSQNIGTFEFTPNPINRPVNGSTYRNPPIQYSVSATLRGLKTEVTLIQDEIDILRQEYVDYNFTFRPTREQIYLTQNSPWNTGNYDYIAAETENRFEEVFNSYNEAWIDYCQEHDINSTGIVFNSAYRNPQRNRHIGGSRNSLHARGRALDLSPTGNHGLGGNIWPLLKQVGIDLGYDANCDRSGTFVNDNCTQANHIHVQW